MLCRKRILFLMVMLCFQAERILSSENTYHDLKNQIASLENAIIQDFSIDLPPEKANRFSEDYSKAATQLAVKYAIQKKLFYKIEEQFITLNKSIDLLLTQNELSELEASKLKTGIEYATRIIMKSRMEEIHELYLELKQSLTHEPKLSEIYSQIKKMNFSNCILEKIDIDQDFKILKFEIKKKNKFGSWTHSKFKITKNDTSSDRLISMPDISHTAFPYNRFITNYWKSANTNNEKKFSLHLDHDGEVIEAEFQDNTEEPLFQVLGLSFGTQKVAKQIFCESQNRLPANLKN